MAICVGITGGIGSGKSTICKMFELLGVPVFNADEHAKRLLNQHEPLKDSVRLLFGEDIYHQGILQRSKLASVVFTNPGLLQQLNTLVHPVVREEFHLWAALYQHQPYIIHEAAILFESGFYKMMDYTILVTAPEEQRIRRVIKRDGGTEAMVRERMRNQWTEEEKARLADLLLGNDNSKCIIPEILATDDKLRTHGTIC